METFRKLKVFYYPFRRDFFLSLFFLLLLTCMTVMYPIILQQTIDEVMISGRYEFIPWIAGGFFLIMLLKGAATYGHQYLGDMFGIRTVFHLRNKLYEKLQILSFKYYDNAKTGDLMSRLTADVEGFRFFLSFGFAELLRFFLLIGISLVVMFYYSAPLTLITVAALPFLAAAVYRFDKRVHPAFRGIRKSFGELNTKVQENISGIQTVKSLSREDFQTSRFSDSNEDYKEKNMQTANVWSTYFPLMEFIGNLTVIALLFYGGYLVIQGNLRPGELVAFFSLVWYILWPIMNLGFVINLFSQSKASGERLLEVLEADEEISDVKCQEKLIKGHVAFRHVSLSYSEGNEEALHDISFEAVSGQTIGLIGATGSGKTSITQLLSRFYEPSAGTIMIDGKDIKEYSLHTLRSSIGVVLQESFLFSSSIKANIAYGRPEAPMEDIISAAKIAKAHDFIMKLPDGYDTLLGERGMGLSGGQKQRIAIARSICINPSILILDDATSAVDMKTEMNIQEGFRHMLNNSTTFIVAHRISSLKHADQILFIKDGRVAERGTHDELLRKKGAYKRIYDLQYKDHVMQKNAAGQVL
ncbi:ATP-binding cassette domain-containing protein [Bacillus lacus]|uniref:ATP-binding cassette domain-containing protein n=1 Tax=Metabacillus lacus TaxID=1983721 RepID=A0A7X2LWL5_9BACI|nr:ABC transporter ATP-binding protein [Metabacillus lacus]MRX71615.1 ATP-binding cassette domain-containing protein [Metabacillus lacus]